MTYTMRRDGSWRVELVYPLEGGVDVLEIATPNFSHTIRWARAEIRSTFALLSELTGVPEASLMKLKYPDVDRVLTAFVAVMPPNVRQDYVDGKHQLVTPQDEPQQTTVTEAEADPIDSRFPNVPEARRFPSPPQFKIPPERPLPTKTEDTGSGFAPPPHVALKRA